MITTDQREQIRTQRASRNDTRRVVDYMGNDDAIVQAARVSCVVHPHTTCNC